MSTEWLESALGYRCRNPALIEAALTHRSAGRRHNERLEFLGDSVLNCVVADLLYLEQPRADEGELSRLRASLVKGETLAAMAADLDLGEHLKLGAGELRSGGFRRESILADALEALLGAIYLDGGFEAARAVIERLVRSRLTDLPAAHELKDPKTRLQELLQGRGLALPAYKVEHISGESHLQTFTVRCEVAGLGVRGIGQGQSRRRAEQEAAQEALKKLEALSATGPLGDFVAPSSAAAASPDPENGER